MDLVDFFELQLPPRLLLAEVLLEPPDWPSASDADCIEDRADDLSESDCADLDDCAADADDHSRSRPDVGAPARRAVVALLQNRLD